MERINKYINLFIYLNKYDIFEDFEGDFTLLPYPEDHPIYFSNDYQEIERKLNMRILEGFS